MAGGCSAHKVRRVMVLARVLGVQTGSGQAGQRISLKCPMGGSVSSQALNKLSSRDK